MLHHVFHLGLRRKSSPNIWSTIHFHWLKLSSDFISMHVSLIASLCWFPDSQKIPSYEYGGIFYTILLRLTLRNRIHHLMFTWYFCYNHHHHHHIALVARIYLTLSRHSSLLFIALGRSSGQHPVSSHSCWMYVHAGRPAFARPCVGVHKNTSLMSSSLLLQQCPACLARLTWIVFVIGGRWPYSWCLVGCCRQDLFKIARSILV